jgi:PRTRC genetic system protein B
MTKKRTQRTLTQNNALGLAIAEVEPLGVGEKQNLKMRIDLFDESIVVTRYAEKSTAAVYELAPDDLAAAFAGLPLTTPVLPPDCVFFGRTGSQDRIAIYLSGGRRKLTVENGGDKHVILRFPIPPLVFVGWGVDYSVFAVKSRPKVANARLYHAPFPNVHPNGNICSGTVAFPSCTTETIHEAARLFLESNFNHDLSSGKCRSYRQNVVKLWRVLAHEKARRFPGDELLDANKTIGDLLGE